MHVKVPEVKKCCCCVPLRWGIIFFGYLNIIFSLLAVGFLVLTTERHKFMLTKHSHVEIVTTTVLFSILGMDVILNVLLLIAGHQKDIMMLRLYNYYGVATTLAALVPTFILLSRMQMVEVLAALFAILMQCYVLVMVRSEVVKLEKKLLNSGESNPAHTEEAIDVSDTDSLV